MEDKDRDIVEKEERLVEQMQEKERVALKWEETRHQLEVVRQQHSAEIEHLKRQFEQELAEAKESSAEKIHKKLGEFSL